MNFFHVQCQNKSCKTWIALKLNMTKDAYRKEVFDIKCPLCNVKHSFLVHPKKDDDIIAQKTNDLELIRAEKTTTEFVVVPMKSACSKDPKPFPTSMSDGFDVIDFGKGLRSVERK